MGHWNMPTRSQTPHQRMRENRMKCKLFRMKNTARWQVNNINCSSGYNRVQWEEPRYTSLNTHRPNRECILQGITNSERKTLGVCHSRFQMHCIPLCNGWYVLVLLYMHNTESWCRLALIIITALEIIYTTENVSHPFSQTYP